ncbi:MAG: asparagine--tRNA ligase [Candidatus Cloacimonetes bacterium]|nr:asparagine--tRNA ligase [Candidatus Cloacimonadota bacterium]
MKIWCNEVKAHLGQEIWLDVWLYNRRGSKKIQFLEMRDGTAILQGVVTREDSSEKTWEVAETLTQESSFRVRGFIKPHDRSETGAEMVVLEIIPVQIAQDYPITKKEHGPDFLLKRRHLWLRSKKQKALMEVRNEVIMASRQFFYENRFLCTDSPILTGTIGEEGSTLFATEYFDEGKAYLAQTGQLYLEATCAAFGKVYCFGPTFRAEKSKTRKHLTEFWMLEAEVAHADSQANMDLQESLFKYIIRWVLEKNQEQLKILERDPVALEKCLNPYKRITYDEAVDILHARGSDIIRGKDLGADDEILLTSDSETPIFVMNYPRAVKAFYMKIHPENPERVLCSDMLAPSYGEIFGSSQREDDYEILKARMIDFGLNPEHFVWYLELRKYGTFVHSGFGMGLERAVCFITGTHHIREAIPFPRMMSHLEP